MEHLLERIENTDVSDQTAVVDVLETLAQKLDEAWDRDETGEAYRDLFWKTHEAGCALLDEYVQHHNWKQTTNLISTFSTRNEKGRYHPVSAHLNNALSRQVIRHVLNKKVDEVPGVVLEYLLEFTGVDGADVEWEESMCVGWAIGHREYDLKKKMKDVAVQEDYLWTAGALEYSFYADQEISVELLEEIATHAEYEEYPMLFNAVAGVDGNYIPRRPSYWSGHRRYCRQFQWKPEVKETVRTVIQSVGHDQHLPTDWTFQDLVQ